MLTGFVIIIRNFAVKQRNAQRRVHGINIRIRKTRTGAIAGGDSLVFLLPPETIQIEFLIITNQTIRHALQNVDV